MERIFKEFKNGPYVTYLLLIIQVVIFGLMTLAGGSTNTNVLVFFGAKVNQLIQMGEWWRLFTPMFLHIGLMHLAVNSVTLYYIGEQIEGVFGHWRFLVIYLLSGFTGNIASFVFSPNLSAGSSTAIFGLFGAFFMLMEAFRNNQAIRAVGRQFGLFIVLNLAFDLFAPGIDLAGHVGGLLGGFLIANIVGVPRIGGTSRGRQIISLVIFIAMVGFFLNLGFNN
ncbi:rhomboid family intramembrane serine protease [Loigolactobacillus backii]|uniref:Rhomboid family intramembrane serine protease n=1 Tax=Loigolactobacillus backii TaxID=375175 RepID=A0A192H3B2_9LACO|nr:rhomboid family intramembrane serine protease [Loigolactobacillus backii]ANK59334.1 rhomboid family intramembrane serine protease [Loigolactobacillus backii]ANK62748.1 rhomboid family intramembrane serine protease [Loigolactobacillus backii]ANK64326.1 rhomboid family intramembrane serine protease [Loigolactobacillus backii]ANK67278.1 rhomboid family intramembrane serine protease [Loigolactobacillus backii]ANK70244.1 rhomboid family intramembrane serine protease [Loigolactobacillus backii]